MTLNTGYRGDHKIWDEIGRITPNVDKSASERPYFPGMPAPWLPVIREDVDLQTYFVVSSGQPVALDRNGHCVPAGFKKAFNKATGTVVLTYVAADVTEKVINLVTGVAVTVPVTYTEAVVTQALKERGLIGPTERAYDFISQPIGLASYNFYKAPGTDTYNPRTLAFNNFRPQANVAITCDYVITVPLVPARTTTETMENDRTGGAAGLLEDYLDGTETRAAGWFSSTQIAGVDKYSAVTAGDDVVCYMFANRRIAEITDDSTLVASVAGLVRRRSSVDSLSATGDYFLDTELGLLFLFEADGDAIPSPFSTAATISYSHYGTTLADAGNSYACATGDINYGDFLTFDEYSNYVKASLDIGTAPGYKEADASLYAADPEYDTEATNSLVSIQLEKAISAYTGGLIGQVIGVEDHPLGGLERVKTGYHGETGATMHAPGSATAGRTDQLTYASASTKMLIVNIIGR